EPFGQASESLDEVEVLASVVGHPDVPSRVETPPVALDLLDGRHLAQPGIVDVDEVGEPLLEHCLGAVEELWYLTPIEPDDVGKELVLFGCEVPMGPVDLAVDAAGVDEKHLVGPVGAFLGFIQEPESYRQRDRV